MNVLLIVLICTLGSLTAFYFIKQHRFILAYICAFCAGGITANLSADDYAAASSNLAAGTFVVSVVMFGEWLYRRYGKPVPPSNDKS